MSIFQDKHFGQWLMLNKPFRKVEDLMPEAVRKRVPEAYQFFAAALLLAPEHWANPG